LINEESAYQFGQRHVEIRGSIVLKKGGTPGWRVRKKLGDTLIGAVHSNVKEKPSLKNAVAREVHSLICTKSKKYASVRAKLNSKSSKASQTTIVAIIATGMGQLLGYSAMVLTPFVAAALAVFISVARNVYCGNFKPGK
jgi:hypothetical protein